MEILLLVIALIYVIVSYRMLKYTIYKNRVYVVGNPMTIFVKDLCLAVCLGFIIIPWGIIVLIRGRR